jgi:hypothetical protein
MRKKPVGHVISSSMVMLMIHRNEREEVASVKLAGPYRSAWTARHTRKPALTKIVSYVRDRRDIRASVTGTQYSSPEAL